MALVSTAGALLSALKFEDLLYSSAALNQDQEEQEQSRTSLWNIPGLGVIGVGSATLMLVKAYMDAMPQSGELLSDTMELAGAVGTVAETLSIGDEVLDQIGKIAEKYLGQAPEEKGGLADVQQLKADAPKAELPNVPGEPLVNTGQKLSSSGMPEPPGVKRAVPSAVIRSILQNTAKSEGVDFGTLYALAGSESSFRSGISAKNSSATGLFQFTARTWDYLVKKVYPELGYSQKDRLDPQKSATVAARYVKGIQTSLSKTLGRMPNLGETYLGYFLGPTGAHKFLQAHAKDPSKTGASLLPSAASSNPELFYANGDRRKPLTLQQTLDKLTGKVVAYYADASQTVPAQDSLTPVQQASAPAPIAVASLPTAMARPQVQEVPVPDFKTVSAKNEDRVPAPDRTIKTQNSQTAARGVLLNGQKQAQGESTYVRDKHGRLLVVRG